MRKGEPHSGMSMLEFQLNTRTKEIIFQQADKNLGIEKFICNIFLKEI